MIFNVALRTHAIHSHGRIYQIRLQTVALSIHQASEDKKTEQIEPGDTKTSTALKQCILVQHPHILVPEVRAKISMLAQHSLRPSRSYEVLVPLSMSLLEPFVEAS